MSGGAEYGGYMDRMSGTNDLLREIEEVAERYTAAAGVLDTSAGQLAAVQENLTTEQGRNSQALAYIEAAFAATNTAEVMLPAHTDMASATGQLAAARYEATQAQNRFAQAVDTTEQQKEPVQRNQQAAKANAAEFKNLLEKLQQLGSLATEAKALAQPDADPDAQ